MLWSLSLQGGILARRHAPAPIFSEPFTAVEFGIYVTGLGHLYYLLHSFSWRVADRARTEWMAFGRHYKRYFNTGKRLRVQKQTQTNGLADRQAEIYTEGVRGERARQSSLKTYRDVQKARHHRRAGWLWLHHVGCAGFFVCSSCSSSSFFPSVPTFIGLMR